MNSWPTGPCDMGFYCEIVADAAMSSVTIDIDPGQTTKTYNLCVNEATCVVGSITA